MASQLICSQCRTILNESEMRAHISAKHLRYFPFECATCKEANQVHLVVAKEDMDLHMSTHHNGNNLGILLFEVKAKEVELCKMVEQCHRFPNQQGPSNDSKSELRRAFILLDTDANGSDDDIIIIGGGNETAASQEHVECVAKVEIDEPDEHPSANSENNEIPNEVLPKAEPSVNISTAPIETNESAEQAVTSPITDNSPNCENSEAPNTILPKAEPGPHNFTELYAELDFPSQNTLERKRRLPDSDSVEKRRLVLNDDQLASVSHCSQSCSNRGSANGPNQDEKPMLMNRTISQRNDHVERPTTSSQVTSSVSADSSCKHIIAKLFIVISEGICCFETIDRTKYDYAPLSQYLTILREGVLSKEYEIGIQFYASDRAIPYQYRKASNKVVNEFTSLDQLKNFADEIRSIARLWSNYLISAHFGHFKQKSNKTLSQSDYCTELFGPQSSIMKCRGLFVTVVENWPLSLITNVATQCDRCELNLEEASPGNRKLHEAFLNELYDGEVLQRIDDISFSVPIKATVNDFIENLRMRFQRSPHKRFKFGLYSPAMEVQHLKDQIGEHILEAKIVEKAKKGTSSWLIIEQRAAGS